MLKILAAYGLLQFKAMLKAWSNQLLHAQRPFRLCIFPFEHDAQSNLHMLKIMS